MHYEVAQMALSANIRTGNRAAVEVTIGEVEQSIQKEDGKMSSISSAIDKLFSKRGLNPISDEEVRVRTEQK